MDTLSSLHIHHIGYLVKKIDKAEAEFTALGYTAQDGVCRDEHRQVDILFMSKDGYLIELISPYSENSVVSGLMKKYKNSPYHICYETDDPEACIAEMTARGYAALDSAAPAPAISGKTVQFFTHPRLGMVEILFS